MQQLQPGFGVVGQVFKIQGTAGALHVLQQSRRRMQTLTGVQTGLKVLADFFNHPLQ
ncbi:hypothetical protein D3C73_1546750 [compost metagenome]